MDDLVRETHSAIVVMVGDRVYKVKKPVRLAFLDFSTVAARRAVAAREVALNRRLAPDVYLGVGKWHAPDRTEAEPVVVMRRMPDDRRLASLVIDGRATPAHIRALARVIAAFHERAERSPRIDTAGRPDVVARKLATDIGEARDVAPGILPTGGLDVLDRLGHRYLAGRAPLLEARVRAGLVRDGHGDLLADDIFCLDDGPRILDCIEFDDRLRWGDVLADVAFLAMDLEHLGAPALARQLVDDYTAFSAEHHPTSLVHYYVAARALIRAKVTAVRVRQGDAAATPTAQRLLDLAVDHLRRGRVTCTLVGGAPGTGKSTLAAALADRLDAVVVSSDETRKDLAGIPRLERADAAYGEGLYDDAHTDATYTELLRRARGLVEHGVSVVLDASWTRAAHRGAATALAHATATDLTQIRCVAPADVVAARIRDRRATATHVSDATDAISRAMATAADPWPDAIDVDTRGALDESVAVAWRQIARRQTTASSSTATINP
ncbi:MAG: hypothetical protein AMXMBFR46_03910 [Acidimicrobiia bacterium]